MRCTNPSRGRARRDEDEYDENTDGLDRPPVRLPPSPKKDGAECRVWCVEEYPDLLRLLCVLCELGVGDARRRTYPADETVVDLPSNQPIVLVWCSGSWLQVQLWTLGSGRDEVFGLKDACVFRRGIVVGRYAEGGFEMLLRNNAPDYLSLRPFFFGFLVWQLKKGKETMQVSH